MANETYAKLTTALRELASHLRTPTGIKVRLLLAECETISDWLVSRNLQVLSITRTHVRVLDRPTGIDVEARLPGLLSWFQVQ